MPDITIVKLKIRRGSNAQRQSVILEQGELGYTTDTKRVFVGDGITTGGTIVGNIAYSPGTAPNYRLTLASAVLGDIVQDQNILYQLTSSDYSLSGSWTMISPLPGSGQGLEYNGSGQLVIKDNGITGSKFASTAAYVSGGLVATATNGLSANVDNSTIVLNSSNQYKLAVGSINASNLPNSILGRGLEGGSGNVIQVKSDPATFGYNGSNQLILSALPSGIVTTTTLSSGMIGAGLSISSNKLVSTLQSTDNVTVELVSNAVKLKSIVAASTTAFDNISYNTYGQITGKTSVIYENLTGQNAGSPLSVFNGYLDQSTFTNQTLLTAMSANPANPAISSNITLSSAGFMSLLTSMGSRVAIPIFRY